MVSPEQESEWRSLQRVGLFKVLGLIITVLFVVSFTFFITTRVTRIPKNASAIVETCENNNKHLQKVNEKFIQLNNFIDEVAKRDFDGSTFSSRKVRAAYKILQQPISLVPCKHLIED